MNSALLQAAHTTLIDCLQLQTQEILLIVTDDESPHEISSALYEIGKAKAAEVILISMKARERHGQAIPESVAQALLHCDVFVGPTTKSFSHTDARRAATSHGIRGATMPGVTVDMFTRLMNADYTKISLAAKEMITKMSSQKTWHISAPNGTNVTLELPYPLEADDGILGTKGAFGNLPAGEVMGSPANTNGKLVFDRMGDIITEPTWLIVENNYVKDIQNNESGNRLSQILTKAAKSDGNKNAYYIAELGIGLHPQARLTGVILEDEKILGTCHLALGDNTSYTGGTNKAGVHLDGVIGDFKVI